MKPLDAYRLYLAMRLHFTSPTYDIVKTGGAVRVKESDFMTKKNRFAFAKMARKYSKPEYISLLAANFSAGDKYGGMFNVADAEQRYKEWTGKIESLSYRFKQDLLLLLDEVDTGLPESLWTTHDGTHPPLIRYYLGQKINLETLVILDKLFKFTQVIGTTDPVLEEVVLLVRKYAPFVRAPKDQFSAITRTTLGLTDPT